MLLSLFLEQQEHIVEDVDYCVLDSLALQEAFQPVVFSLAADKFAHETLDAYLALIRLSVEA